MIITLAKYLRLRKEIEFGGWEVSELAHVTHGHVSSHGDHPAERASNEIPAVPVPSEGAYRQLPHIEERGLAP